MFEQSNCAVMKDLGKSAVDAMFAKGSIFRYDVSGVPYAYYKRLTDTTGVSIYDNMVSTWSIRTGNEFNVDFKLYSNLSSAEADSNPWRSCNGDHATVGFPRDCGPLVLSPLPAANGLHQAAADHVGLLGPLRFTF